MAEPNPIWGLHLAPGALAGALVLRTDSGYEVVETFTSAAPTDAAGLQAAAVAVLGRRGVRGRAALVAAADHSCTVRTCQIPSEELYLNEEEIFHQLHDFAPFEPGAGHLLYVATGKADARRFLLAGIPFAAHEEIEDLAQALDGRYHGIGLATSVTFVGALALGLVGDRGYLVHVQARLTAVLAIDGERLRRYLLPVGIEQCAESADVAALLATDILRTTAYHVEQARRQELDEHADETPDIVLVGATAAQARALVGPALGRRLAAVELRHGTGETVSGANGARLDHDAALACVGALGAALQAFRPPEARLVLRHPPTEVPEYRETTSRGWLTSAAAIVVICGLAAAGWMAFSGGAEKHDDRRGKTSMLPSTKADASPGTATGADDARAALDDLALRETALRCAVAASAALGSGTPALESSAFSIDSGAEYLRWTLFATVEGPISASVRRDARAAVERIPGVEQISVDVVDGALRIRGRSPLAGVPDAGDGDRVVEPRLRRPIAGETVVEQIAGMTVPERIARVLLGRDADSGPPVALTAAEHAFAESRFAALTELLDYLPRREQPAAWSLGAQADGSVTFQFAAPLNAATKIERRRIPDDEGLPGEEWIEVGRIDAGATEFTDEVPGASGRYAWRLRGKNTNASPTLEADVAIAVDIELVAVGDNPPSADFVLRRRFGGETVTTSVRVVVGETIAGTDHATSLTFATGFRLVTIVSRIEEEASTITVPRFRPDGKIERDEDGAPRLIERPGTRSIRVFEVSAEDTARDPTKDPTAEARTWVRKMTDR